MNWHLGLWCGRVILVSGYPVFDSCQWRLENEFVTLVVLWWGRMGGRTYGHVTTDMLQIKLPKTNFFPFFFFSTTIEERVETTRRLYVYSHNHCPAGYWKKKLMRLLTLPSPVRPFRSLCCAFFHMNVTSATVSVSVIWPSCQVKAKGKEWPWNGRQVTMGFPSDCPPKSTN